jgi:hypothetical protein
LVLGTAVALGGQPPPAPPYLTFARARAAVAGYERSLPLDSDVKGWRINRCRRRAPFRILCQLTEHGEGVYRNEWTIGVTTWSGAVSVWTVAWQSARYREPLR